MIEINVNFRAIELCSLFMSNNISPDLQKTEAIGKMKPPTAVTELRRFMAMIIPH